MKVSITLPANVTEEVAAMVQQLKTVGNLAPIPLQSADGLRDYLCAPSVDWKSVFPDVTFEPDETVHIVDDTEEYENIITHATYDEEGNELTQAVTETLVIDITRPETAEEYELRIVTLMLIAFEQLNAGDIEAITMSKELFIKMMHRPEFKQPEQEI